MTVRKIAAGIGVLFGTLVTVAVLSPSVFGYVLNYTNLPTYFTASSSMYDIIRTHGASANISEPGVTLNSNGYVLPNKQRSQASASSNAGGAIGTLALNAYSGANNKEKLYNLLQDKNRRGTEWERMGSAFIVHQMLQKEKSSSGWGSGARTISNTEWADLRERFVNNSDVVMTWDPGYQVYSSSYDIINTAGVRVAGSRTLDVSDVLLSGSDLGAAAFEPAWVFTVNGDTRYVLEVNCANPVGGFDGFDEPEEEPDPTYTIAPSISMPSNGARVKQGTSVTARGSVRNNGPDNATAKNWYLTRLIYAPGASLPNQNARTTTTNPTNLRAEFSGSPGYATSTRSATLNNGATSPNPAGSNDWSYNVTTSVPVGSRICYVVSVRNPTERNNNPVWSHSRMNCVTVDPPQFNITPTLEITGGSNRAVNPGDTIRGPSRLNNSGPDTSLPVTWRVTRFTYNKGNAPSTNDKRARSFVSTDPCATFPGGTSRTECTTAGFTTNQNPPTQTIPRTVAPSLGTGRAFQYVVPSNRAAGSTICFVTSVSRPTQDTRADRTWRHSAMQCVTVRDYDLTPTISDFFSGVGENAVVEQGASGTIRPRVDNGGPDTSRRVEWRITQYIYSGGSSPTSAQRNAQPSSSQRPCAAFTSADRTDCTDDPNPWWRYVDGSNNPGRTFPIGGTNGPNRNYTVPDDLDVGTKVCFVASVSPPTANSTPVWRHSQMYCLVVGKKPKIQVWGGDVRAGGEIRTSTSTIGGRTYGSWGEYAALSNRQNSGFSTGTGLNEGHSSHNQGSWSRLTFANTGVPADCGVAFGCYNFTLPLPLNGQPVIGQFELPSDADVTLSGNVNLNSTALANGIHKASNVTLTGTTIGRGKYVVIEATGTVTISGNIAYNDGPYSSVRDIPQVVVRAPRINIQDNVTRVDAWLFAVANPGSADDVRGVLNTCSNRTGGLTADICNLKLTINGPVISDEIHLRRTAGSEPSERYEPAEIFNLRADAYLWGNSYGSRANQIRTVHIRELSPRF